MQDFTQVKEFREIREVREVSETLKSLNSLNSLNSPLLVFCRQKGVVAVHREKEQSRIVLKRTAATAI